MIRGTAQLQGPGQGFGFHRLGVVREQLDQPRPVGFEAAAGASSVDGGRRVQPGPGHSDWMSRGGLGFRPADGIQRGCGRLQRPAGRSDLMLSPAMRPVTGATRCPPGERRWGNTSVTTATRLRLDTAQGPSFLPARSLCRERRASTMSVAVTDTGGKALIKTRPRRCRSPREDRF